MLHSVDILPSRRSNPRRAVALDISILCDLWAEPISHRSRDISSHGVFFDTDLPLEPGTELVLEFFIHNTSHVVIGCVQRAELDRAGETSAGMGILLLDVDEALQDALDSVMHARPPALPRRPAPRQREFIWVETLLTYEEDLGDRVNTFEISDVIAMCVETGELDNAFDNLCVLN